jgi:hypothetical protein
MKMPRVMSRCEYRLTKCDVSRDPFAGEAYNRRSPGLQASVDAISRSKPGFQFALILNFVQRGREHV